MRVEQPSDRSRAPHELHHGSRLRASRRLWRPALAVARRSRRRRAGAPALPAATKPAQPGATRVVGGPCRAEAAGCDPATAVGGVPDRAARRLRAEPVLRALRSSGGAAARSCDSSMSPARSCSSTTPGRPCEVVDPATGEVRQARDLRRRARRLELHLRRGDAGARRCPTGSAATFGALDLHRRGAHGRRARQPEGRRHGKACRFEPAINRTYAELAGHYGTAILPARPPQPRDKAKVEVGVSWSSAGSWRGCATGASSPSPS